MFTSNVINILANIKRLVFFKIVSYPEREEFIVCLFFTLLFCSGSVCVQYRRSPSHQRSEDRFQQYAQFIQVRLESINSPFGGIRSCWCSYSPRTLGAVSTQLLGSVPSLTEEWVIKIEVSRYYRERGETMWPSYRVKLNKTEK